MSPRQTFTAVENVEICVLFDGTREQCAESKKQLNFKKKCLGSIQTLAVVIITIRQKENSFF